MRRSIFVVSWTFVTLAAVYDVAFAWRHRATFLSWELNPFMRWLDQTAGLQTVFLFKFAVLMLASGLACYCYSRRQLLARAFTPIIVSVHALLLTHYATACV